jgi:hypothetical protein
LKQEKGQAELPPIPSTPPKGDRVLGFELLGVAREDRLVSLVYLVCLVCLVEPDRPDRPDEPDQPSRLARPASLALHAPLSVALADFFNILLNPVLVKFDSIDQS